MFHDAIKNPQLLTLVNPGRPPKATKGRSRKKTSTRGGKKVAKTRMMYRDPSTNLIISAAAAKALGIKGKRVSTGGKKKSKAVSKKRRKVAIKRKSVRRAAPKRKATKSAPRKRSTKALKKARSGAKKARKQVASLKKQLTKKAKALKKVRKAKSSRGKYTRGVISKRAKAAAARARKSASRPKRPTGRAASKRHYLGSFTGARKRKVKGHSKAGWSWTPGRMQARANGRRKAKSRRKASTRRSRSTKLRTVRTPTGTRYMRGGKFITKAAYTAAKGRSKSTSRKRRKSVKKQRKTTRRKSMKRGARRNPSKARKRSYWAKKRMRRNAGLKGAISTVKELVPPVLGTGIGFFSARAAANYVSSATWVPAPVQPFAPMLAQVAVGVGVAVAGQKVPILKNYQAPAMVGVGLSVLEAVINRFAPIGAQAYVGVPNPGLGSDLDVYRAALRGYGLDEGWGGYAPGDEELLSALEAQDLGEYIEEPLSEYIEEPLSEYIEEPMGEYIEEPMGDVDIYEAMAEYVEEPLSGTSVYEAMAGDSEIDFYLQEAGLSGAAPAAEEIGMYGDGAAIESDLDAVQNELEELDVVALSGTQIEALDGDVDIFDQGMGTIAAQQAANTRQYATHIHKPIKGGGIFGDDSVAGQKRVHLGGGLALNARTLRFMVSQVSASAQAAALTGPAKAAHIYAATKTALGVPGSTPFRLAFADALKQTMGTPAPQGVPLPIPADGAPMLVKAIPAVKRKGMSEITDQWAGMVGGVFEGTIFSQ